MRLNFMKQGNRCPSVFSRAWREGEAVGRSPGFVQNRGTWGPKPKLEWRGRVEVEPHYSVTQ